jgi:RNA polymerase sigma-70 factor, ECF subfamily
MIGPAFAALLGDAKGGDEHAFGVLYRDLQPSLLRYLRVLAPGAAEDLAAETWLRVVRQLGRFGGAEPAFRAWVFLIARHRAIDWRRLAVRRQTDPVPVTAFVDQWAADDPAACALEAISTQAAITLIASLPVEQAEVILLRVWLAWRSPGWLSSWASLPGRCGCWPTGGCVGWPSGWAQRSASTD